MARTEAALVPAPTPNGTSRRGRIAGRALTASAVKLDPLATGNALTPSARSAAKKQPWQSKAWSYYDEIGEIWFAMNFVANALRKAKLIIAKPSDDPTAEPDPIDLDPESEDADGPDAAQAQAELDRIQSENGGQGEILASAGLNLSITGEGYLVGWHPDGTETEVWDFLSTDQIDTDDGYVIRDSPTDTGGGVRLGGDDYIARIWRKHPRWRGLADSPMRAVLGVCDELLILSRAMRAAAVSRASGNGVFLVPQEVSFGSIEPSDDEPGDNEADPFTEQLIEYMATPIQEPDSASAAVPLIVRSPSDYIEKFKHITFDRPLDDKQMKQRDELIRRIANGLDLPAQVLLGLADVNHWTAWAVDDQTFSAHLEPLLVLICWALTTAYLRPALEASSNFHGDPNEYVIWYDATAIVKRPNQAEDANDVFDRGELSGESLRRAHGFTEDDAPTDEDKAGWTGENPAETVPEEGPPLAPGRSKVPPGETGPVGQGNVEETPPTPGETPGSQAVTASGRDRLPLGAELLDLERGTRYRLAEACEGSLRRTLEIAGAKLRRKVGSNPTYSAIIRDAPNREVAARLGRAHVTALGFVDDDLVDSPDDDLHRKYDGIVGAAQRRVAQIAHGHGAEIDPDRYVEDHAEAREGGWAILAAGLAALAAQRLYNPHPSAPLLGEHDTTMSVPIGLIRGALGRAGGSVGTIGPSGAMTVDTNDGPVPAGGVALGPDAMEAFVGSDQEPTGRFLWTVGAPTFPFEQHQDLDGAEFDSWYDEQLAADPGEFPFVNFYAPGDHDGCQCDAFPQFDDSGGPAPLAVVPEDGQMIGLIPDGAEG